MGKIYAVRFEKIGGDRTLDCKIHILGDISIRGDHELQRVQFCRDDTHNVPILVEEWSSGIAELDGGRDLKITAVVF